MTSHHKHGPMSLAERLQWLTNNLPSSREELDAVNAIASRAKSKQADRVPQYDPRQTDFWPELSSPSMAFYAGAASQPADASLGVQVIQRGEESAL